MLHAIVAVLAGGRSRRMGTPKAAVELGGRPLIAWPLAAAAAAGLEAVVVAKPASVLPPLAVPVWHEPVEPSHPLAGVVAALEQAGGRPVVAVACDQPWVPASLLAQLAALPGAAAVVAPRVAGRLEPFPGRYAPAALAALQAALAVEAPVRATLAALDPLVLDEPDLRSHGDPVELVASLNAPEDLARAAARLASR